MPASNGGGDVVADLQARLEAASNARTRDWWTSYLKGTARFRGVPMEETRRATHAWWSDHDLGGRDDAELLALTGRLLRAPDTEDKLAAVLVYQEILIPAGRLDWQAAVAEWGQVFDEGAIADWNACDWFCVKALGPLIEREGAACGRAVAGWIESEPLWKRRASTVAFVNLVKYGDTLFPGLVDLVLANCAVLVDSDERFSQTAAGWVLRELSRAEPERVASFVDEHEDRMSAEALKNASKKLEART